MRRRTSSFCIYIFLLFNLASLIAYITLCSYTTTCNSKVAVSSKIDKETEKAKDFIPEVQTRVLNDEIISEGSKSTTTKGKLKRFANTEKYKSILLLAQN